MHLFCMIKDVLFENVSNANLLKSLNEKGQKVKNNEFQIKRPVSISTDATVEDTVQVRVFNHNLKMSHLEMAQLVKNANLEKYGFMKKTTQELNNPSDSPKGRRTKKYTIYYYKDVPCNRLADEEVKLDKLLNGAFGPEVDKKVRKDVRKMKLDKMRKCSTGVEIHYQPGCTERGGKIQKRGKCWFCLICSVSAAAK